MKHELLVPAGNMDSLNQAIANGADAIYIGCEQFSARKFADNFTNEEVITAIKLCHLYGVKLYAAMNTLIKDDEVPMFLGYVEFLYKNNVDAIIVQDFGMICLIREKYPNLEVHASTQANISSREAAALFHKLGVKRVVFSRELSLKEIEDINTPIEKEVFIHGALCISYSGCCLMSSMLGGRSGNKGECAGCCRLPYTLKHINKVVIENKYLLSTKELNTTTRIKELVDSKINSFKIEGRMKTPKYVGFITRLYRHLIDNYGTNINLEAENDRLKTIFNRGFTVGHLFNCSDSDLMNIDYPNHMGLEIGKVIEVTDKKIKIELTRPLNQLDGIRFLKSNKGFIINYLYDENGKLTNSADNICYVDNRVGLKEKDIVCKTIDHKLMDEYQKLPARKIYVTFKVLAKIGEPFTVEINDGTNNIKVSGSKVERAQEAPLDIERLRKQIEKLGDTPFVSKSTVIESDNDIFINIKEINEIRRTLTNKLMEIRMNAKKGFSTKNLILDPPDLENEPTLTVGVNNEEQFEYCNNLKIKRIYMEKDALYNENKNEVAAYYKLPRNRFNIEPNLKRKNLVNDYFDFSTRDYIAGDYGLNVTNVFTAYYLHKMEVSPVTISAEFNEEEILKFIKKYKETFKKDPDIEVFAYGRLENMIIKGNILDLRENDRRYTLTDPNNRVFPVYFDGVNTHILSHEKRQFENIEELKKVASLRLDFYDETIEEIEKLINKYR